MLEDLLEISRHDSNTADLLLEEIDMRVLVEDLLNITCSLAQKMGVEVITSYDVKDCICELDLRRVKRIIRNILFNVYEYSEKTPIEILVVSDNTTVCVRVKDSGVGMTKETARNVFDRFYRADPSHKRTIGGTGLGMAIALEDAKLHNGSIEVCGELNKGSTLMLVLPVRQDVAYSKPAISINEDNPELFYDLKVSRHGL